MAGRSTVVGAVGVLVRPIAKGLNREMAAQGTSAGKAMGQAINKAVTASKPATRVESAMRDVERAQERLAAHTERSAARQRKAQEDVRKAQLRYNEVVERSGKDSAAAKNAAYDLELAQQRLANSAQDAAREHDQLAAELIDVENALRDAQDASKGLSGAWDKAKQAGGAYKSLGDSLNRAIGPKVWGGIKLGALGAAGAIGGALTKSLVGGWGRLSAIENAEAKLTGLGHSAESVTAIMDNALASVKGTAFGLDEAAGLAGTLVASGIEPGQDLEKTLSLVADSATIAGRELGDMGLIWGSVAAKGKLQGDDAMQLLSSGIPIWQMVGDVMGKTAAEAQELGSKGEVSFEIFRQAMEQGVGGAALDAGSTTQGAFKNMGAAMSRFGAALLKHIYPLAGPLFTKVTEFFDYLTDAAGPAVERLGQKLEPLGGALQSAFGLLATGEYDGGIFGLAADSPVVGFLSTLRDAAIGLWENALVPLGTWIGKNWKLIAAALGGLAAFFGGAMLVSAVSTLGTAIGGVLTVGNAVLAGLSVLTGALTAFFTQTETGRGIVTAAWAGIQRVVAVVAEFFTGTVWPALVQGWELLKTVATEVWNGYLKPILTAIGSTVMQIWSGVVIPAFRQFGGYLQDVFIPIVTRLWQEYMLPAFTAIGAAAVWLWHNAVKPAVSAMASFWTNVLGPTIVWLWQNIVSPVFGALGKYIAWVWNTIIFPALDAFKYVLTVVVPPALRTLWSVVKTVWNGIQTAIRAVVSWFQTWAWPVISVVIKLTKRGFNGLRDVLRMVWFHIQTQIIRPVVLWFRGTAWPIISSVLESIKAGFNRMRDTLRTVWNTIRNTIIAPVANWFRDTVKPIFTNATKAISNAFTTMKNSVKKAWDGVKSAAKAPVKFVVQTVVNDALVGNFNKLAGKLGVTELPTMSLPRGFARGGVLPGWSRMRDGDDQLVPMRRGEGVLVSEGLRRRKDRAAFLAVNAAARRGVGFSDMLTGATGFAGGGILGKAWKGARDLAGHALDKVLDGIDFVAEAIKDPKGIFTRVFNAVAGEIPGAGFAFDAAKQAGKKLLNGIIEQVTGAFTTPAADGGTAVGKPPEGASRSLGYAQRVARSFGLTMTSFRRGGARTAAGGYVSLHALGRAMDFSNSTGPTPQMMAFFNAMHPLRPTELLYSPAGGRQWRRSGRMSDTSGATKRMHYNHVHVGFAKGGILDPRPTLFDSGGVLPPGLSMVLNESRKPEAVLTNEQLRQLQVLTTPGTGVTGGGDVFNLYAQPQTAREVADELMWAQRTRKRRARYAHAGR